MNRIIKNITPRDVLNDWTCRDQRLVIDEALRNEEKQHFIDRLAEIAFTIKRLPTTGETDGTTGRRHGAGSSLAAPASRRVKEYGGNRPMNPIKFILATLGGLFAIWFGLILILSM